MALAPAHLTHADCWLMVVEGDSRGTKQDNPRAELYLKSKFYIAESQGTSSIWWDSDQTWGTQRIISPIRWSLWCVRDQALH